MAKKRNLNQRRAEREERVKFNTARLMQNQIESSDSEILTIDGINFKSIEPEWPVSENSTKIADIVVLRPGDRAIFVIETKRITNKGKISYKISPFALFVVEQAKEYAIELKCDYYATFNGKYFVAFRIKDPDDPIDDPIFSLEVLNFRIFASNLLNLIARILNNKIKPIISHDLYSDQLKSYFDLIYPQYHASLIGKIKQERQKKSSLFFQKLREHMENIDRSIDDENDVLKMAKEATYILIDKLLFYQLLSKTKGYHLISLQKIAHRPNFSNELRYLFQSVVDEINFGPIFSSGELFTTDINDKIEDISEYDDIYDVPLENFKDDIVEFIAILQGMDLNKLDATQLGYFFEKVIPIKERRELGQYYTPKPIIELINKLAIKSHKDKVFDPACGSGGFLVSAYRILKELKDKNSIQYNHITLLNQIKGNDIRRFPTHLSAISLAIQELQLLTHEVEIMNEDFFNIFGKAFKRFSTKISTVDRHESKKEVIVSENFDAIVMNPPYIRQEKTDKKLVSKHLNTMDLKSILDDNPPLEMSGRSDIYCYFITHAWNFLREGGRVGAIISDRWLDTEYGEKFQKILLRLYKIKTIISIDKQAFDEPLIGSVIVILEKCLDEKKRDDNIVEFLRIKQKKSVMEVLEILEDNEKVKNVDNSEYSLYVFPQKTLDYISKWSFFLFFDFQLICFLNYIKRLVNITKYAEIIMGIKSGANSFFFRKFSELNLDLSKYFTPLLVSLGQVDKIQFNEPDPQWGILDLKKVIEPLLNKYKKEHKKALEVGKMLPKYQYINSSLKNRRPKLYEYIKSGERENYPSRKSIKSREFWYYLGDIRPYQICLSTFYWKVFINPIKTNSSYSIGNQLLYVDLKSEKNTDLLAAWLNTDIVIFFLEILSRRAKGERLDRLQLRVYEAKELPCPDFELMTKLEVQAIQKAWNELLKIDLRVDFREDEPSPKQIRIRKRWQRKKYKIDVLFLKFLFPLNLLKAKKHERQNEKNLFLKECFKFYKELWDDLCSKYTEKEYDKFILHILKLILDSNSKMLRFREKGGKEQQEELVEIDLRPINGAEFLDLS